MISALPLFLEATLGTSKIWNWFTREARLEASEFKRDENRGIVPIDSSAFTDIQLDIIRNPATLKPRNPDLRPTVT